MLISPQHHAIILRPRDINRIKTLIPHAVPLKHNGYQLLAVPHRMPEVRVLNNIGIKTPSPILSYYNWPAHGLTPFEAQRATAAFITLNPRCFVLSELGVGKTLAALWATDYLLARKTINKVLIVAPLSTLHCVWEDSIREHFLHRSVVSLYGSATRRRSLLLKNASYYVINHDGVATIAEDLIAREDIDCVIIDEVAVFRNATTDKWKALRDVIRMREYVVAMTGGPVPNSPTDAWAQIKLVRPDQVTKRFTNFRDQVMVQRSLYKWEARPGALTTVYAAMQPSIRFTRNQCVDLPPVVYLNREATLTKEQTKAFKEMLSKYATEYAGGLITAANAGVKTTKLLQILLGVVYSDDGTVKYLPCQPRLDVVRECIEEAPAKVIVFSPFINSVSMLRDYLSKHYEVATVWGEVGKNVRDKIFSDFQTTDRYKVLIAHPACMAHGINLTRAATIVWAGPASPEQYEQACARITRPGQILVQTIIHIEATNFERAIYTRLKNKLDTQAVLLEMLKEGALCAAV